LKAVLATEPAKNTTLEDAGNSKSPKMSACSTHTIKLSNVGLQEGFSLCCFFASSYTSNLIKPETTPIPLKPPSVPMKNWAVIKPNQHSIESLHSLKVFFIYTICRPLLISLASFNIFNKLIVFIF
jgi:hypothetical protein